MASRKIDVHAHFVPDFYRQALLDNGITNPDGMPGIPAWSVDSHLAYMNATGIAKSILSISSPGTSLTPSLAINARLTRDVNAYAAEVVAAHPSRFGFFACVPFSDDVTDDAATAAAQQDEIAYALDVLHADGIALLSNNRGIYLGDPRLRSVLEELDRRRAVVFLHPSIGCCGSPSKVSSSYKEGYDHSSPLANVYRAPLFEFFFDSGRAVLDLLMSGTAIRFPRVRWVVSHCGNVLPSLFDRMFLVLRLGQRFTAVRDPLSVTEDQLKAAIQEQLWFDLAGDPVPNQIDALLKFTTKDRLVFGSDVPWTPFEVTKGLVARIERDLPGCVGIDAVDDVWEGTARKLFSRKP